MPEGMDHGKLVVSHPFPGHSRFAEPRGERPFSNLGKPAGGPTQQISERLLTSWYSGTVSGKVHDPVCRDAVPGRSLFYPVDAGLAGPGKGGHGVFSRWAMTPFISQPDNLLPGLSCEGGLSGLPQN